MPRLLWKTQYEFIVPVPSIENESTSNALRNSFMHNLRDAASYRVRAAFISAPIHLQEQCSLRVHCSQYSAALNLKFVLDFKLATHLVSF